MIASNLAPLPADRYTIARMALDAFETTAFAISPERQHWLRMLSCLPTRDEQMTLVEEWAAISEHWQARGWLRQPGT